MVLFACAMLMIHRLWISLTPEQAHGPFDLVVCDPIYRRPEPDGQQRDHEPWVGDVQERPNTKAAYYQQDEEQWCKINPHRLTGPG